MDRRPIEHAVDRRRKPEQGEERSHIEAAVERAHGVFGLVGADHEDADDAGDEVDREHDEREENSFEAEDREQRRAEDHRSDILCSGGLKDVRSTACAVADVVTDQIGDHRRVAWVVLGYACFDFTDEIGADVGGLGIDAAAELREEGDQRSSKAEAYELEGNGLRVVKTAKHQKQRGDAEQ